MYFSESLITFRSHGMLYIWDTEKYLAVYKSSWVRDTGKFYSRFQELVTKYKATLIQEETHDDDQMCHNEGVFRVFEKAL